MSGLEVDRGVSWEGEDAIIRPLEYMIEEDALSATCLLVRRLHKKLCMMSRCILVHIVFLK